MSIGMSMGVSMIDYSNDMLDIAQVEWFIDKKLMRDEIRAQWAIVTPEPLTPTQSRTLAAMRGKYYLPDCMRLISANRDVMVRVLRMVAGPVLLVGSARDQWRPDLGTAKCAWSMDSRAGVWWDHRPVVTCGRWEIPNCESSCGVVANLLQGRALTDCVSNTCVICGRHCDLWDRDAVPYCNDCWPDRSGAWEKARVQLTAQRDSQMAW